MSNIMPTSHLAWYSRMWMSNVQYHANFTLPLGGALLMIRAEFIFINKILSLWKVWEMTSLSSLPVCLANCLPKVLITWTACGCQQPRVSTGRGMKCIPWALQSSQDCLFFLSNAWEKVAPAVSAALNNMACYSGLTTVTSIAVSCPWNQDGRRTSAALESLPGSSALFSLKGLRAAWLDIW